MPTRAEASMALRRMDTSPASANVCCHRPDGAAADPLIFKQSWTEHIVESLNLSEIGLEKIRVRRESGGSPPSYNDIDNKRFGEKMRFFQSPNSSFQKNSFHRLPFFAHLNPQDLNRQCERQNYVLTGVPFRFRAGFVQLTHKLRSTSQAASTVFLRYGLFVLACGLLSFALSGFAAKVCAFRDQVLSDGCAAFSRGPFLCGFFRCSLFTSLTAERRLNPAS
jgi:hypothetical protein